ncbi:hypothetical protein BDZ89DRAFT_1132867 [Hymenopellis radicata]|nr:hypothetical protein BDZ89DRAFT_1132867 [Hymenopellis radicata]
MFAFCRAPFLIALGLACCLVLCVQSHPMNLEDRATSPMTLAGRATSPMTLETRSTITMRIKGKDYTLKKLSRYEQGENSVTYSVVGGYGSRRVPAIVKIIDPGHSKTKSDDARKERDILDEPVVDQLLAYEKEKKSSGVYKWTLVLRDIHKDYPRQGDRFAPLYEILDANPSMSVSQSVSRVRRLAIRHAEALAESGKFVYRDIQPLNVFTNADLSEVAFIDYGFPSVVDVSSGLFSSSGQAQIKKANALKQARENAEKNYTTEKVRRLMGKSTSSGGGGASSSNA